MRAIVSASEISCHFIFLNREFAVFPLTVMEYRIKLQSSTKSVKDADALVIWLIHVSRPDSSMSFDARTRLSPTGDSLILSDDDFEQNVLY